MALKVKLVRSVTGRPHDQKETVIGLGLRKMNDERLLRDTAPIRGMIAKVSHLVSFEEVPGDAPVRQRRKGKKKSDAAKRED